MPLLYLRAQFIREFPAVILINRPQTPKAAIGRVIIKYMIYDIAGFRVQLNNKYPFTEKFCQKYLAEDQITPPDISATVTEEEFAREKELSPNFSDGYIENICLYRSLCLQIPKYSRMLLHASVLEYDGTGYAFLGRSGTGKSTHTRLWLKYIQNTRVLNGDKPILQEQEDHFIAYGTPWQGKEGWGCKGQAPLKGLCFLEQAKENTIRKLSPAETASRLFLQILMPQEEETTVATLDLADHLIQKTPAYLLKCDISETAVKTSFEYMTGQSYEEKRKVEEKDEN